MKMKKISILLIGFLLAALIFGLGGTVSAETLAQQPTGSIPTVTGTISGPMATVRFGMEEQINVRSGPNTTYDAVGILLPGQSVPALGKSQGGGWVLVRYMGVPGNQGWVWSNYVDLTPGELPIVEPPPEPTPVVTQTIDPTLAAQFIVPPQPTRLPTFTQAPTLEIPEFEAITTGTGGGIPLGLVILILVALGMLVGAVSFLQPR